MICKKESYQNVLSLKEKYLFSLNAALKYLNQVFKNLLYQKKIVEK